MIFFLNQYLSKKIMNMFSDTADRVEEGLYGPCVVIIDVIVM